MGQSIAKASIDFISELDHRTSAVTDDLLLDEQWLHIYMRQEIRRSEVYNRVLNCKAVVLLVYKAMQQLRLAELLASFMRMRIKPPIV